MTSSADFEPREEGAADFPSRREQLVARFVVPLLILLFCVGAYYLSTQFDRVPPILKRGIQPSDFPQLVIGLIGFLTIWLALTQKVGKLEVLTSTVWGTLLALIGFLLVAEIDLFLGLGLFAFTLALMWGERRLWALVLVGLIIPVAVFFLFDGIFEVRFPRGPLTNLWYQ
ncbi:tripartite tricarboxylate transporter TctB family protein [Pseudovibrio flavus]|uniref:tripartite tricarboxylate transporter TctB family protein n=1 Tax=Pseudovibrio flavus TaxID=2529854 RepID=UPI00211C87CC|nr:tripartite tricarboxylate transporter TctB family protein [Pseudovibrio flavus]